LRSFIQVWLGTAGYETFTSIEGCISPEQQSTASYGYVVNFLGAFAKFRNATFSFVMSESLSAWNYSAPTGRISMKFRVWVLFENI
jgi:hypothetical protein